MHHFYYHRSTIAFNDSLWKYSYCSLTNTFVRLKHTFYFYF